MSTLEPYRPPVRGDVVARSDSPLAPRLTQPSFWRRLFGARDVVQVGEQRFGFDDYITYLNLFGFNGVTYSAPPIHQTLGGEPVERVGETFESLATMGMGSNAVVAACMAVRMHVGSAIRFSWQRFESGRPSALFTTADLALLETPWPGGTTQDLLARCFVDADLAGNSFWTRDTPLTRLGGDGSELVRLRPDWVRLVLDPRVMRGAQVGWRKVGFAYYEGGENSGADPVFFGVDEVVHYAPTPDPLATWRGMSPLTPIVREIQADHSMTQHKGKFFENGATPNMVITYPPAMTPEAIRKFRDAIDDQHAGVQNAYKRLHLGGGADATVVGTNLQQMTFKEVQGAGETRIAAALGTPPVIVGLSEGMQGSSLNAGNYGMARRRFADGTMHPLWQNLAGSFAVLFGRKPGGRLWYDARDVPFLREDEKAAAEIDNLRASTMRTLVDAGYTPESVLSAVTAEDFGLLKHSGMFSVQLQPPGTATAGTLPQAKHTEPPKAGITPSDTQTP